MSGVSGSASGSDPERVPEPAALVARLREISPDLRGCALLDRAGELLAASGEGPWAERCTALLEAAEGAAGRPVEEIHVATDQGEVFAVRLDGLAAVAVSERFALASLMVSDLRAALRDLTAGEAAARAPMLSGGEG